MVSVVSGTKRDPFANPFTIFGHTTFPIPMLRFRLPSMNSDAPRMMMPNVISSRSSTLPISCPARIMEAIAPIPRGDTARPLS
jgi:hypothetical protein